MKCVTVKNINRRIAAIATTALLMISIERPLNGARFITLRVRISFWSNRSAKIAASTRRDGVVASRPLTMRVVSFMNRNSWLQVEHVSTCLKSSFICSEVRSSRTARYKRTVLQTWEPDSPSFGNGGKWVLFIPLAPRCNLSAQTLILFCKQTFGSWYTCRSCIRWNTDDFSYFLVRNTLSSA